MINKDRPQPTDTAKNYGLAFDHMLEGCQIISRDFRYLYVNDVVVKQGRLSREDMLGKKMKECYPGIEKTEMYHMLESCVRHGESHNMENEFQFPDGSTGWFELHMEPLPEGAVILSVDITERKKTEEHTRRLEELKTTFMMIVSHQLRTPLSIVRSNLESLKNPSDLTPSEQHAMLSHAYTATLEVVDRLNEVLRALEAEEAYRTLRIRRASVEKIWLPILSNYQRKCKEKGIDFTYAAPKEPCEARIDKDKITSVLESLAENAFVYTPKGGSITASLGVREKRIRFEISDNGIGIPEDEQSRVFNRFFRGSNALSASPDASGLSLAVARYYIQQHGGTIGFRSSIEHGSDFWFEIPEASHTKHPARES